MREIINEQSLFPIVYLHEESDWEQLFLVCEPILTSQVFQQLKKFLCSSARCAIVERAYIDKDYRDTYSGFYSRKFADYPSRTLRLHFFARTLSEDDIWDLEAFRKAYIGYSVIRPTRVTSLGRTILDPSKIAGISGTMCLADYKVNLLGAKLTAKGFPFTSQHTDVTVCAHATCWMIFRYFSEKYNVYKEAYPFAISQMTSDTALGRLVPSPGLTINQISELFSGFGFHPVRYCRQEQAIGEFDRLLYYYIESGLPVVCALSEKRHAVVVLGHISDYDTRMTPAGDMRLNSSFDYVKGYVINDDNHMPYQAMWASREIALGQLARHCSEHTFDDVDEFVVPLYEKMHLGAEHIERLAAEVIERDDIGLEALSPSLKRDELITRIFLTSSKSYKAQCRRVPVPHGVDRIYSQLPMPKFIWVCELLTPSLFPKGKVVGEIIWDATASQWDTWSFIVVHYPEYLIVNDRNVMGDDPVRLLKEELPSIEPYNLYRNNLKEVI